MSGPKKVHVARSIQIQAQPEVIQSQLLDFKFFNEKWSPWIEKDTTVSIHYEGESGLPGSKYTWSGNKEIGKGSMELLAIRADTIFQHVVFQEPHHGSGDVYLICQAENGGTKVNWEMNFDLSFLSRGFMRFMNMDKYIGTDYEKGLAKLKQVMESPAPENNTYKGFELKEVLWQERDYYGKKALVSFAQLNTFFEQSFPPLFNDAINLKLSHTGPPSGLFYTYDEVKKQTECAAVIAVPDGQKCKGWQKFTVPASDMAIFLSYKGPYEKMAKAHQAISDYMKEKGYSHNLVIEEYISGPLNETDSSKWVTNIYYIINSGSNLEIKI